MFAARAGDARATGTSAEHHRPGRTVEFRNGHHDGALDRQQAAFGGAPLIQRLEFQRMGGEVGYVQGREHIFGGFGIVVGRSADQREAGQRHQCVDLHDAVTDEKTIDRGTRIEAGGEGWNHAHALRFQRGDHAVVVTGVAGQQVRAQHQHADRALGSGRERDILDLFAVPALHPRVIDAHLRVGDRQRHRHRGLEHGARTRRITADQVTHHVAEIVLRAGEPVLQRQKIGAHVLGGARNEAQHLRQAAQHFHLLRTRRGVLRLGGPQALEQRHRAALGAVHAELAEAGEAHDLGRRHRAEHGIAVVAAVVQGLQQWFEMILHEQHGGDDDVGPCNVRAAVLQRRGFAAPFVRGVNGQRQSGKFLGEPLRRP